MNTANAAQQGIEGLPGWVPPFAIQYLAHTEKGISIRELARNSNCHASTVMRQIRRVETRREDPLIDAALVSLGACVAQEGQARAHALGLGDILTPHPALPSDRDLHAEVIPVLKDLSKPGAVLAVAPDLDKAVVVQDTVATGAAPGRSVARLIAEAMALQDWITCLSTGRISRYRITPEGRAALIRLLAARENQRQGLEEQQAPFQDSQAAPQKKAQMRFHTADSPLVLLSRRRDKDGKPFLGPELIRAAERLREDFELAQLDRVKDTRRKSVPSRPADPGRQDAKARLQRALDTLGEGLSDIAVRCCCFLDGMESTEKRLGWPARSGKIVLRIALIRLSAHYNDHDSLQSDMIG